MKDLMNDAKVKSLEDSQVIHCEFPGTDLGPDCNNYNLSLHAKLTYLAGPHY